MEFRDVAQTKQLIEEVADHVGVFDRSKLDHDNDWDQLEELESGYRQDRI